MVTSHTNADEIPSSSFEHCSSVVKKIIPRHLVFPSKTIKLMAGDVASAFRNACTHSECLLMFAGHIPEDNAIVMDLSAAFGWAANSGLCWSLRGAVAFIHGSCINDAHPNGFYNYHWVDDHVNVAPDTGTN
ncbi:hypothetical protein GN958_ATG07495 [Phytophthora infestans]|uniref:Uncharacterized protein n=1 Tax=Phytophthora infestans TaxID=4787 RepID=A0A8S9TRN8_PHYIN|nr:hypothetical protein GN958_ATG19265 [Phytophthora infestans]KAF4142569.1 hypothetical protein GN958_ATG08229 [Phytophthora infestans]KAF4143315.1 hypothetical protein GN958_ATG07495 [Phytophthora infestans]